MRSNIQFCAEQSSSCLELTTPNMDKLCFFPLILVIYLKIALAPSHIEIALRSCLVSVSSSCTLPNCSCTNYAHVCEKCSVECDRHVRVPCYPESCERQDCVSDDCKVKRPCNGTEQIRRVKRSTGTSLPKATVSKVYADLVTSVRVGDVLGVQVLIEISRASVHQAVAYRITVDANTDWYTGIALSKPAILFPDAKFPTQFECIYSKWTKMCSAVYLPLSRTLVGAKSSVYVFDMTVLDSKWLRSGKDINIKFSLSGGGQTLIENAQSIEKLTLRLNRTGVVPSKPKLTPRYNFSGPAKVKRGSGALYRLNLTLPGENYDFKLAIKAGVYNAMWITKIEMPPVTRFEAYNHSHTCDIPNAKDIKLFTNGTEAVCLERCKAMIGCKMAFFNGGRCRLKWYLCKPEEMTPAAASQKTWKRVSPGEAYYHYIPENLRNIRIHRPPFRYLYAVKLTNSGNRTATYEESVTLVYDIAVWVSDRVTVGTKLPVEVKIMDGKEVLATKKIEVEVIARTGQTNLDLPSFRGVKTVPFSLVGGFVRLSVLVGVELGQAQNYKMRVTVPMLSNGEVPYSLETVGIANFPDIYPWALIWRTDPVYYTNTRTDTPVPYSASWTLRYVQPRRLIESFSDADHIVIEVIARVMSAIAADSDNSIFVALRVNKTMILIGAQNYAVSMTNLITKLTADEKIHDEYFSTPQSPTTCSMDENAPQVWIVSFPIAEGRVMILSRIDVIHDALMQLKCCSKITVGESILANWNLKLDVEDGKKVKGTQLNTSIYSESRKWMIFTNIADNISDIRKYSSSSWLWKLEFCLELKDVFVGRNAWMKNETKFVISVELYLWDGKLLPPKLSLPCEFRTDKDRPPSTTEGAALFSVSKPKNALTMTRDTGVVFKLTITFRGMDKYKIRVNHEFGLVHVCRLVVERMGDKLPGCQRPATTMWDQETCSGGTLDLGLIKPLMVENVPSLDEANQRRIYIMIPIRPLPALTEEKGPTKVTVEVLRNDAVRFTADLTVAVNNSASATLAAPKITVQVENAVRTVQLRETILVNVKFFFAARTQSPYNISVRSNSTHSPVRFGSVKFVKIGKHFHGQTGLRKTEEGNRSFKPKLNLRLPNVWNSVDYSPDPRHENNMIEMRMQVSIPVSAENGTIYSISISISNAVNSGKLTLKVAEPNVNTQPRVSIDPPVGNRAKDRSTNQKTRLTILLTKGVHKLNVSLEGSTDEANQVALGALLNVSHWMNPVLMADGDVQMNYTRDEDGAAHRVFLDFGYVTNPGPVEVAVTVTFDELTTDRCQANDNILYNISVIVDEQETNFCHKYKIGVREINLKNAPQLWADVRAVSASTVRPGSTVFLYIRMHHLPGSAADVRDVQLFIYSSKYLKYIRTTMNSSQSPTIQTGVYGLGVQYTDLRRSEEVTAKLEVKFDADRKAPIGQLNQLSIGYNTASKVANPSAVTEELVYRSPLGSFLIKDFVNPPNGCAHSQYTSRKFSTDDASRTHKTLACMVESSLWTPRPYNMWTPGSDFFTFNLPPRGSPLNEQEYLQVYFARVAYIMKVHTLSSFRWNYMTSFTLQCSQDGLVWEYYRNIATKQIQIFKFPEKKIVCNETLAVSLQNDLVQCRAIRVSPRSGSEGTLRNLTMQVDFEACVRNQTDIKVKDLCLSDSPLTSSHPMFYERGYIYIPRLKQLIVCSISEIDAAPYCSLSENKGNSWLPLERILSNVVLYDDTSAKLYGLYNNRRSVLVSDDGYVWKSTGEAMPPVDDLTIEAVRIPWEEFAGMTPESLYTLYGIRDEQTKAKLFSVAMDGVYSWQTAGWKRIFLWGITIWT